MKTRAGQKILYVKSFMTGLDAVKTNTEVLPAERTRSRGDGSGTSGLKVAVSRSAVEGTSRSNGLGTYRVWDSSPLEVRISAPLKNKTDINHTD